MSKHNNINNAVFISYRRDGGDVMAQLLNDHLVEKGYNVFYDIESIPSGDFLEKLDEEIGKCVDFLLILPPNGLDRCKNEDDIVRREIRLALKLKKNIIPVMMRGFVFPDEIPEDISKIKYANGVLIDNMNFFNAKIDKVVSMLFSKTDNMSPLFQIVYNKKFICTMACIMIGCLLACALGYILPRNVENMNYNIVCSDMCSITYTGRVFLGKPDGEGELLITWKNGAVSKYDGFFDNGYPNGSGTYHWSDGESHAANDWSWKTADLSTESDFTGLTHFDQRYGIGFNLEEDGNICFGEWKDDRKYGYNEVYLNNQRIQGFFKYEDLVRLDDEQIQAYQGYTVDGEINCYGTIWYKEDLNLYSFSGLHNNGVPILGVCTWNNGSTYEGLFDVNGNPGNQGVFIYANGDTIESKKWGYDAVGDTLIVNNGTLVRPHRDPGYVGMLIDEKCVGYGSGDIEFVLFLRTRYEGEYKDGIPDGNGTIRFNEKSWYVGNVGFQGRDFMWDSYHSDAIDYTSYMQEFGPIGEGRFCYYNGERLSGNWSILQEFDGYMGMIYNSQRNGIGSMKYGNNSLYYVGEWRNDLPNGFGSFYFEQDSNEEPIIDKIWTWETRSLNEGTYTGLICDDVINGYGTYTCNTYTYEGGWRNGEPCGHGKKMFADGTVEEGIWKDGKLTNVAS